MEAISCRPLPLFCRTLRTRGKNPGSTPAPWPIVPRHALSAFGGTVPKGSPSHRLFRPEQALCRRPDSRLDTPRRACYYNFEE
ncbi:MAG: hypothetical protein SPK06_02360 [Kiritimatiellia bacterium]|nr:hypothetical protein [Kiritimatiellia bacterium]